MPAIDVRAAIEQQLEALRHKYASYHLSDKPFTPGHDRRITVTRFVTIDGDPVREMTLLRTMLVLTPQDVEGLSPHLQVFVGMQAGEHKKVLCPELFPEADKRGARSR